MGYTNTQKTFQSRDGLNIFYQSWTKKGATKTLVIQHGFGEHSDRYGNILETLKDEPFNIYALDARGHGRSDGKRGHVDQFQQYIDDLTELIHIAKSEDKREKVILLGHSLGGVIALQYACEGFNQDNLFGLVISAPAIKVRMDFEKEVKKVLADVLAKFIPDVTLDANLDVNFLSHDKSVVEAYQKDKLVHGKVSFQMGSNLFHLAKSLLDKASLIKVPIFIVHGDDDGIADVDGSRELFRALTIKEKSIKIYPGLYHELMNETEKERKVVLADIKAFLSTLG